MLSKHLPCDLPGHPDSCGVDHGGYASARGPSAEDRLAQDFHELTQRAGALAESWINGNHSAVLEQLENHGPELALLFVNYPHGPGRLKLARELHRRSWDG